MTSTLPSSTSPTLSGSRSRSIQFRTCADPRGLRGDGFTESEPRTIVTEQEIEQSTEESQIQNLRVGSLHPTTFDSRFYCEPCHASKRQTWMTNKFVFCWLHLDTCRSEKQVQNDHKSVTLEERFDVKFVSKSELFRHRETCGMALKIEKNGPSEFSEREQLADVSTGNESVNRDAYPANVAKSLLEGNRDHLLTQART